jgi:hypothetical protein
MKVPKQVRKKRKKENRNEKDLEHGVCGVKKEKEKN